MSNKITEDRALQLTKIAISQGKLLELGWIGMLLHVVPKDASQTQVDEMRKAFYMGAEHLWGSIMNVLDGDKEPTAKDMERMELIHTELEIFRKEVTTLHPAPGWRI